MPNSQNLEKKVTEEIILDMVRRQEVIWISFATLSYAKLLVVFCLSKL